MGKTQANENLGLGEDYAGSRREWGGVIDSPGTVGVGGACRDLTVSLSRSKSIELDSYETKSDV